MTQQDLNTVNIKGKDYVPVAERVRFFNENYTNGSITTEIVSEVDSQNIVVKAIVRPDVEETERIFTGHSQATVGEGYINKTAALENAETSAVGRALGMMGIGITDSVASADEVSKATFASTPAQTGESCSVCKLSNLPQKTVDFSKSKYGKVLCYRCQDEQPKGVTL